MTMTPAAAAIGAIERSVVQLIDDLKSLAARINADNTKQRLPYQWTTRTAVQVHPG